MCNPPPAAATSQIPVIGWAYVKGCNREDRAAGRAPHPCCLLQRLPLRIEQSPVEGLLLHAEAYPHVSLQNPRPPYRSSRCRLGQVQGQGGAARGGGGLPGGSGAPPLLLHLTVPFHLHLHAAPVVSTLHPPVACFALQSVLLPLCHSPFCWLHAPTHVQPPQGFRPYVLHTTYSTPPGAAWEGQAVRDEQVYAPQGSAVGPY